MSEGMGTIGIDPSLALVVGTPNDEVNAWGINKKDRSGRYERCTYPNEQGASIREWPLSELSLETIRERWGSGEFRVCWFIHDPENDDSKLRRRSGGTGQLFALEEETPVKAPAPASTPAAPPAPAMPEGFMMAMQIMQVIDRQSDSKISGMAQLAQAMSSGNRGLDASTLGLLLTNQQSQMTALIAELRTQHDASIAALQTSMQTQLTALRAELIDDGEDEDDDEGASGVVAEAARAGVGALVKPGKPAGDAVKAAIANWFISDPANAVSSIVGLAQEVPRVLTALQQQTAAVAAPASVPTPPPAPRPRAIASVRPVAPAVVESPAPAFVPDPLAGALREPGAPVPASTNGAVTA